MLAAPPRSVRSVATLVVVAVTLNLFWHGAQPYAVGLIPTPWDKLAHSAVFGAVALLAGVAIGARSPHSWTLGALAGCALALADEAHQLVLPGRQADVLDLVADLVGVALSIWLARRLAGRSPVAKPLAAPPSDRA